jgi:hypothetical protein
MSLPNLLVPFLIPISKTAYLLLLLYGNLETLLSRTLSTTAIFRLRKLKYKIQMTVEGAFTRSITSMQKETSDN